MKQNAVPPVAVSNVNRAFLLNAVVAGPHITNLRYLLHARDRDEPWPVYSRQFSLSSTICQRASQAAGTHRLAFPLSS